MERVIDIKINENSVGLVDLEKSIYDIFIIDDDNVKRKVNASFSSSMFQEYLQRFEQYLISTSENIRQENFKNTSKKRLTRNLIAAPFYLITISLFASYWTNPFGNMGFESLLLSVLIGIASSYLANSEEFYIKPEEQKILRKMEKDINKCQQYQQELVKFKSKQAEEQRIQREAELENLRRRQEALQRARITKHQIELKQQINDIHERFEEISKK